MSNYLTNLVARSFTQAELPDRIQPRLPSRFEPIMSEAMSDDVGTIATVSAEDERAASHRGLQVVEDADSITRASAQIEPRIEADRDLQRRPSVSQRVSSPETQVAPIAPMSTSEKDEDHDSRDEQPATRPSRAPVQVAQVAVVVRDHSPPSQQQRARSKREVRLPAASRPGSIEPQAHADHLQSTDQQASPSQQQESTPVIQVTIGRVEVRAVTSPHATSAKARAAPQANKLSLTDYLNGRPGRNGADDKAGGGR